MRLPTTLILTAGVAGAAAQDETKPLDPPAAIRAWLDAEDTGEALLHDTVAAVVDADKRGIRALAKAIEGVGTDAVDARRRLNALLTNVGIEVLKRQTDSGMVYDGQYDRLLELQPYVGRFYLELIIDTPNWFPDDMRALVVPALRDLYPKGPDRDALDALMDIATDEDFEPENLRSTLGFALAQWGRPELVQARIDELKAKAGAVQTEDELPFARDLANTYYLLRDYEQGSKLWLRYLRRSEELKLRLVPEEYYNAACNLSLSGNMKGALAELERCSKLMLSGTVDESQMLEKKLFEEDPDMRAVRPTRKYQELVKRTFPDKRPSERAPR